MEKAIIKETKVGKKNEKEDRQTKWATKLGFIVEQTAWKIVENHVKA
jgi:hypothetical protein